MIIRTQEEVIFKTKKKKWAVINKQKDKKVTVLSTVFTCEVHSRAQMYWWLKKRCTQANYSFPEDKKRGWREYHVFKIRNSSQSWWLQLNINEGIQPMTVKQKQLHSPKGLSKNHLSSSLLQERWSVTHPTIVQGKKILNKSRKIFDPKDLI